MSLYDFTRNKMAALTPEAIRPTALVTGEDLIAAGYSPGPQFKEILSAVEDGQLEGNWNSKDAAMKFVSDHFPPA